MSSAMGCGNYEYKQLATISSFRLINLHPSPTLTTPISCTIFHSTLQHYNSSITNHYIALSYVWGPAADTKSILVDGTLLEITATLDSALRHVRDRKRSITVWADGVCINQSDVEDKNHQVRLMGSIYEIARHTIIYLGPSSSDIDAIIEYSEIMASSEVSQGRSGFLQNVRRTLTVPKTSLSEVISPGASDLAKFEMLQRPWFTRVWVLQELVLSGDPWVQFGSHRLRWNKFASLLLNKRSLKDHPISASSPGFSLLANMDKLRNGYIDPSLTAKGTIKGPCGYLLQVLRSRRGRGVFDPRDMIFAHLGMVAPAANQELDKLIDIDYGKPLEEVYTHLALYILRQQGTFDFLTDVEDIDVDERRPRLPTWVPDWTATTIPSKANVPTYRRSDADEIGSVHCIIKPKALSCLGELSGVILAIQDVVPPVQDVEILRQRANELSDTDLRLTESDPLFDMLCSYFCTRLGVLTMPCFQNLNIHQRRQISSKLREVIYYPQKPGLSGSVSDNERVHLAPGPNMLCQFLLSLVGRRNDVPNHIGPEGDLFTSKRIALLDNGSIAVVPRHSRKGDVVTSFHWERDMTYVLRPAPTSYNTTVHDLEIISWFAKNQMKAVDRWHRYTPVGQITWEELRPGVWKHVLSNLSEDYSTQAKKILTRAQELPPSRNTEQELCVHPEIKPDLDALVISVMESFAFTSGPGYKADRILLQTNISEVKHFQFVGRCFVDTFPDFGKRHTKMDRVKEASEDGIASLSKQKVIIVLH